MEAKFCIGGHAAKSNAMFVVGRSSLRPRDVTRTYYRRFLSCPRTIKMPTRRISVAFMHFDDDFLNTSPLVFPLLVHDQAEDVPIEEMPDVSWMSAETTTSKVVPDAYKMGITKFFLFAKIEKERETPNGAEAYNKDGLVPRTLRLIKESCPDALIFTDIGLEMYGYKSQGGQEPHSSRGAQGNHIKDWGGPAEGN